MAYQIECVVSEVVLGEKVLFSFEPTSKYQLKIDGKTINVAVDLSEDSPKVVAVPSENLKRKPMELCKGTMLLNWPQGVLVVLEVDVNGTLVVAKQPSAGADK